MIAYHTVPISRGLGPIQFANTYCLCHKAANDARLHFLAQCTLQHSKCKLLYLQYKINKLKQNMAYNITRKQQSI